MPEILRLRDYQLPSVEALRQGFRDGHRTQILMAPTGFGKTIVAAHLLDLTAKNGKRAAIFVDRVNLVDQTSKVLFRYGIDHGIEMSGHHRRRAERIQVCSVQTLEKQESFPEIDLLIVDECHDMRSFVSKIIKSRPKMKVIGLSATPFKKGLGDLYSNLVNVCTTDQLLDAGELVRLIPYAAKPIDMSGASTSDGEWKKEDVTSRGIQIVGDIVAEWQDKTLKHFGGPVKTLVFSASVAHGEEICRQFNAAGYNFQQVTGEDGDREQRQDLIDEFKKPDSVITGLVACEVFTKGFDVQDILCGISARPYRKSLSSHIQQMGRVMRTSPGKTGALWLDHSGNYMRFQDDVADIYKNGLSVLADGIKRDSVVRKEPTEREKEDWTCTCGYVFARSLKVCPGCGKERIRLNLVENVPGTLEAVGHAQPAAPKVPKYLQDRTSVWRQLCGLARTWKKDDLEAGRRFAQAQYRNLYGHFFDGQYQETAPEEISSSLKRRVLTDIKKYKTKQKAAHA
ncbi:DEAD/DEAH box helicase [Castellaniella hirudinis]|uniref:DEAD/DEAH box helicase n=1 Tax=Castellaniella hirudinis TaxID=1144617 RepID=UPI0039C46867